MVLADIAFTGFAFFGASGYYGYKNVEPPEWMWFGGVTILALTNAIASYLFDLGESGYTAAGIVFLFGLMIQARMYFGDGDLGGDSG